MIKRIKEKDYVYKHPLGELIAEVEVGVSDSSEGRRSLSANEIKRLSRMVAMQFLRKNYHKSIVDSDFTLAPKQVRAIMALLDVNQSEFADLIGCQRAKVSKILSKDPALAQRISKSQAQLALERLSMELARPGAARALLHGTECLVSEPDEKMILELEQVRFGT